MGPVLTCHLSPPLQTLVKLHPPPLFDISIYKYIQIYFKAMV